MNPLQYTSEEMFSSTELIRKSKLVFDKLHKKDIEKAIILRDGKPSFMLLDFSVYEEIMSEYLSLKELLNKQEKKDESKEKGAKLVKNQKVLEEIKIIESEVPISKEIDDKDLEEALAQIDNLNLDDISENKASLNEDTKKEEKEPLKEFWE